MIARLLDPSRANGHSHHDYKPPPINDVKQTLSKFESPIFLTTASQLGEIQHSFAYARRCLIHEFTDFFLPFLSSLLFLFVCFVCLLLLFFRTLTHF